MIFVEPRHKKIIEDILKKYPYTFYAFGSRVKGTHRTLSDLDICFTDDIPLHVQSVIKEDFELSNLPFTVDLVDFKTCDKDFQNRIKEKYVLLQGIDTLQES